MQSCRVSIILLISVATCAADLVAMGNLAVVIKGEKYFTSEIDPNRPPTNDLWCQANKDGEVVHSTWGRFVRVKDRKSFVADMDDEQNKARLHFGQSSAESAGKYRCEVRLDNGEFIFGNMFAYSQPVFKNNDSYPLKVSDKEPALVVGDAISAAIDATAIIPCPVLGYPEPNVVWFKDNFPVEEGERFKILEDGLQIDNVAETDAGIYRCVATNQFATKVDGDEQQFELKLDQQLKVGGQLGWLLPLAIIIITLLILFIVIYACQRCAKYKADHYNVAERERTLHSDQQPLKNSV